MIEKCDKKCDSLLQGRTVAFLNLGCKVNSYETEAMKQLFLEAGAKLVEFEEQADIYVVNTCTVTNIADRKSRQMLHRAKNRNPEALVVAVGCYAQEAGDVLLQDKSIDLVIGNNRKKNIVELVTGQGNEMRFSENMSLELEYEDLELNDIGEKTRAYIKIQDGCNQFCSYCIIPFVRGRVRSRKKENILAEVERLVGLGYHEIVLTGIHISSYGKDRSEDSGQPLLELLQALCKIEGLCRLRLGSLEPRIITEDFVKDLAKQEKICPHFHLSLQSGCNDTLKRMNRHYFVEDYMEKCTLLRSYFVNPAITTDIIVGFPGETDEEFEQTKFFLKRVGFSQIHIFKFSMRKGTKASTMPMQISEQVKSLRSELLHKLEKEMRFQYLDTFLNQTEMILTEEIVEIDGEVYMTGHNERYIKIAVKGDKIPQNTIFPVYITNHAFSDFMLGERI